MSSCELTDAVRLAGRHAGRDEAGREGGQTEGDQTGAAQLGETQGEGPSGGTEATFI